MLQTRTGKRSGAAAVRVAVEMVYEKLIDKKTAVQGRARTTGSTSTPNGRSQDERACAYNWFACQSRCCSGTGCF
jgi:hypothetical protein